MDNYYLCDTINRDILFNAIVTRMKNYNIIISSSITTT